jgi:hypothetical protein
MCSVGGEAEGGEEKECKRILCCLSLSPLCFLSYPVLHLSSSTYSDRYPLLAYHSLTVIYSYPFVIAAHLVDRAPSMRLTPPSISNLLPLPCPCGSESGLGESLKALAGILEALYSALSLSLSQSDTAPAGIAPLLCAVVCCTLQHWSLSVQQPIVLHCTLLYCAILFRMVSMLHLAVVYYIALY